ncbi:MAG: tyrosine protein phosphatase [Acidobacteria bacterium]|nr:tyrosine protein phosphatase [Acidobacteriota bacterium]
MNPTLYWIPGPWKGRLAITSRPRGWDWLEDEVNGWVAQGVHEVVSLLEPQESEELGLAEEAKLAGERGIHLTSFPIPDRGIPASFAKAHDLLCALQRDLSDGRVVAVHCRQSVGRSSLLAAGLLILSGVDADRAVATVAGARGITVPETQEQLAWIRKLALVETPLQ